VKMFDAGKTRMIWLPYGEKITTIVKPFSSDTGSLRTDRQMDRIAIPISHVSVLTSDKKTETSLVISRNIVTRVARSVRLLLA